MNSSKKVNLPQERTLWWIGSSQRDLVGFPPAVKDVIATALQIARLGGKHDSAKPWKGEGPNVFEIVADDGDAYRVFYWAKHKEAIYALHSFQKKSTQGIKTPKREIDTVSARLKQAKTHYGANYGAGKKKRN